MNVRVTVIGGRGGGGGSEGGTGRSKVPNSHTLLLVSGSPLFEQCPLLPYLTH